MDIQIAPKPGQECWNKEAIESFARVADASGKLACNGCKYNTFNDATFCSLEITPGDDLTIDSTSPTMLIPDFRFIKPSTDYTAEAEAPEPIQIPLQTTPLTAPQVSTSRGRVGRFLRKPL